MVAKDGLAKQQVAETTFSVRVSCVQRRRQRRNSSKTDVGHRLAKRPISSPSKNKFLICSASYCKAFFKS